MDEIRLGKERINVMVVSGSLFYNTMYACFPQVLASQFDHSMPSSQ